MPLALSDLLSSGAVSPIRLQRDLGTLVVGIAILSMILLETRCAKAKKLGDTYLMTVGWAWRLMTIIMASGIGALFAWVLLQTFSQPFTWHLVFLLIPLAIFLLSLVLVIDAFVRCATYSVSELRYKGLRTLCRWVVVPWQNVREIKNEFEYVVVMTEDKKHKISKILKGHRDLVKLVHEAHPRIHDLERETADLVIELDKMCRKLEKMRDEIPKRHMTWQGHCLSLVAKFNDSLFDRFDPARRWVRHSDISVGLDLGRPSLCGIGLGESVEKVSQLGPPDNPRPSKSGLYCYRSEGFWIEASRLKVTGFTVILRASNWFPRFNTFSGKITFHGTAIVSKQKITQKNWIERFGEPYVKDIGSKASVLFYEFGTVEWQVTCDENDILTVLTIVSPPWFEDEELRRIYNIDKPWPPPSQTEGTAPPGLG